jgi:anti-sigma B factor antagonist
MSADQAFNPSDGATLPPGGASRSDHPHRRPALRVRAVDGTAVVDIIHAETLIAEEDISHLANQLHRLAEDGHARLVLNFREVQTMSSDVLGVLVALHRRLEKSQGRLVVSSLDPVLRAMLRICRLERVFDLHADEAEASGAAGPTRHPRRHQPR